MKTTAENLLSFLEKYPVFRDWLNTHSFSCYYVFRNDDINTIYTHWSDSSSEAKADGTTDAKNWILICYDIDEEILEINHRMFCVWAKDGRAYNKFIGLTKGE